MKKILMFTLLFGLITVSYAGNKIATDYYYAGEYAMAKSYFLSGNIDAMDSYYLGQIYLMSDKKDSAQYYFNKGLQLDANNAYNKIGIATINNDSKELESIAKDKDNKKNVSVLLAIAEAYQRNNDLLKSDSYIEKAKKADKKNPLIYIFEGDMLKAKKLTNDAATKYENAIYYNSNCKIALLKLAQIYETVRISVAVEDLNSAISADPQYVPALSELADLSYRNGFYPQALDAFNKYMALIKPTPSDYAKYAEILYFNKKYDQTLDAIAKAPNTFVVNRLKMYSENQLGQDEAALATGKIFLTMAKAGDVYIPQDYTTYADLLAKYDQSAEAAMYNVEAYKLDTTKTDILNKIAKEYLDAKDYTNAAKYYDKIATGPNGQLSDVFMLGRTYYIAGSSNSIDAQQKIAYLHKADSTFSIIVDKVPDNYMGYFWRARANSALDPETSQGLAKPYYEKAVEVMVSDSTQYKNELMEAYRYLGYYNYLKNDMPVALSYFNKVLELDPNDTVSSDAIKGIQSSMKAKKR